MNTSIFYMINAALYFYFNGTGILIDGVHEGHKKGFSSMPVRMDHDLRFHTGFFSDLRGALFTHLHDDHYDRRRLEYLMQFSGRLSVYGPQLTVSNVRTERQTAGLLSFTIENTRILSMANTHDGEIYRSEPHRSFFLTSGKESFFVAGDAVLRPYELSAIQDCLPENVTAAFVNHFQAASVEGQEYLRRLNPERIFLYHLPFPEDDEANYWRWARQLVQKWPSDMPKLELPEPMGWIEDNRILQQLQKII